MTGYQLRAWRKGHGLSQAALAEMMGVGLRTYIRFEQCGPSRVPNLVALATEALQRATGGQEEKEND